MDIAGENQQGGQENYGFQSQELQWSPVTPQYMPWGHSPSAPAAPLVTFTAQTQPAIQDLSQVQFVACHNHMSTRKYSMYNGYEFGVKRKASFERTRPSKQHITEEKMAAHMSRLNINSESSDVSPPDMEEPEKQEKRLFMCEEMRRLQTESILPSALIGRLERPCMAVMLWQPPSKLSELPPFENRSTEDQAENNNNLTVDLNSMEFEG